MRARNQDLAPKILYCAVGYPGVDQRSIYGILPCRKGNIATKEGDMGKRINLCSDCGEAKPLHFVDVDRGPQWRCRDCWNGVEGVSTARDGWVQRIEVACWGAERQARRRFERRCACPYGCGAGHNR